MSLRPIVATSALLVVLGTSSFARADDDLERARALFDEAGELERQGQWGPAQERLRAAIRIKETPHLRYALAWALENGGRLVEARTEYELAQRLAQRSGADEVSRLAAGRIVEVDRKTPLVQVRVKGRLASDARVFVDDHPVTLRDDVATLPVDPGTRVVRVERPGKNATEHSVSVGVGVLRVVEIRGDEDVRVTDDGQRERGGKGALPWVLVTAGGISTITGVALFVASTSDVDTRDESMRRWCDATACANGTTATRPETADAVALREEAYRASSRGNTKQILGGVFTGLGVVGVAVGTYLLLDPKRTETASRPSRVSVDATPLAGGAFGAASLRF